MMGLWLITLTGPHRGEPLVGIAVSSFTPYRADEFNQLLVGCAAAHQRLQVVTVIRNQTGHKLSVGGQAGTRRFRQTAR